MIPMRIIGCGNLYRGDDAAGLLVVHRLCEMGLPAEESSDDLTRLLSLWQPEETVYVVDAAFAQAPAGTVLRYLAKDLPKAPPDLRFSSHGIDLAEIIGLAGALGKLPRKLTVIGIVGENFDAGMKVSPAVRSAVETVVAELAAIVRGADAKDAETSRRETASATADS